MAGNTLGKLFRVTTWGESHGDSIGCVIDGCPAGIDISDRLVRDELERDIPYPALTKRVEKNDFRVLSGVFEGKTIGTPISIMIQNDNVISDSYRKNMDIPRPGHADLTYRLKYGHVDWRGGSRASGRTWISLVAAGAVARQICGQREVSVSSRILELGGEKVDEDNIEMLIGKTAEEAREGSDATGGIIEVRIDNAPKGLGSPAFNRFQADLGHAVLNIPGIRSFELGSGADAASMKASEFNDEFHIVDGDVVTSTNHAGGTLGGITYGAPVIFRAVVKPTPSILKEQRSVDIRTMEETMISTKGRFDANFTPRVLVVAEAVSMIVTADHLMISGQISHDSIIPNDERLRYSNRDDP